MANAAYKDWYVQGLQALKSASDQGKEAASDTMKVVTSPELKKLVEASSKMDEQHAEHIASLLKKTGGNAAGMPNKIMEGIRAGNRQVVDSSKDAEVRDASVIAAAQIAMHYYIASYGTLAATAKHLGMNDDAKVLKQLVDETKQNDERFSQLAEQSINKKAA